MPRTHSQIINLWGTARELACDLESITDRTIEVERVRRWRQRNRIPTWWWSPVINASKKRRFGVTNEELALGLLKVNGT